MTTERPTRTAVIVLLAGLAAGSGGCSTMNNTEKGVGLGGLVGAGLGTAVGAATGNPKTGAVVGGLVGAGVGGAVGNSMDRDDQQKKDVIQARAAATASANAAAAANANRLTITEVIQMVSQGHDEQVIINQIRNTGSTFTLHPADLDLLRQNNVPSAVIIEMQNARPLAAAVQPRPVVIQQQPAVVYQEPAVVYVQPRPVVYGGYYYRRGW
ncbi:MAG TPA: glycine zipper domain-containing protein [Urbifossiella sp.]|nr:glycine zipper domain-containing protein [Urbifossiella sp.]